MTSLAVLDLAGAQVINRYNARPDGTRGAVLFAVDVFDVAESMGLSASVLMRHVLEALTARDQRRAKAHLS
jgi:hypothetical protein